MSCWLEVNRKEILFYSMPLWSCHKQWDFIGLFQVTLMDGIYNEEWFLRPNTTKKTENYIWYMRSMYECKYARHSVWRERKETFCFKGFIPYLTTLQIFSHKSGTFPSRQWACYISHFVCSIVKQTVKFCSGCKYWTN